MYDGAYAARDHGVSLAFITSNEIYWQVRYERERRRDGRGASLVGYKDFQPDPVANPALRTILWRDLGRPEQQLSGVQLPTDGFLDWGGLPFVPIHTRQLAVPRHGPAKRGAGARRAGRVRDRLV